MVEEDLLLEKPLVSISWIGMRDADHRWLRLLNEAFIGINIESHSDIWSIGRVAAGTIAEKFLKQAHGIEIVAFVSAVGHVSLIPDDSFAADKEVEFLNDWHRWWKLLHSVDRNQVDSNEVRCPDEAFADKMRQVISHHISFVEEIQWIHQCIKQRILAAKEDQNSIGGIVTCVIRNVPAGLGEPCFDKLEAKLGHAMLSIPATKGFEIGSGFAGVQMPGHVHNDPFVKKENGKLGTSTNFSGGIQVSFLFSALDFYESFSSSSNDENLGRHL